MSPDQKKRRSDRDDRWYRTQRRNQSHKVGKAAAERQKAPAIPDHPLIPSSPPELITTPLALDELIGHLRDAGSFAYDTEFIGELSYFPRLCLIQVATTQRIALVDPFEIDDLDSFWSLLANPKVQKIVHAGVQDLEPVVRNINKPPANIADTQIAAGFMGLGYPTGLAKLVQELLGVALGKGLTYTNWAHRPMSAVHKRYAANDVRFLPALKAAIDERIESLGRPSWVARECAALSDRSQYEPDPQNGFARIRGATGLSPDRQQVLRALLEFRDAAAREQNTPPRALLKDEMLIKLARHPVSNVEDLAKTGGLPRPVRERHGQAIVEAIDRALVQPAVAEVAAPRPDETTTERIAIDSLWAAVTGYCLGMSVDPALASSRQEIATCYRAAADGRRPAQGRLTRGWRKELLGRFLDDFMTGKTHVRLDWAEGMLRAEASDGPQE